MPRVREAVDARESVLSVPVRAEEGRDVSRALAMILGGAVAEAEEDDASLSQRVNDALASYTAAFD